MPHHARNAVARTVARTAALLLLLCLFGTVAAQDEDTVTIQHAQGETDVPLNPEVVLSFDFAAADTLQALGVQVDGLPPLTGAGQDRFDTEGTIAIGTLFEPDYEAVNAADPDLIIIAGRSSSAYADLSRIAPTIDLTFSGEGFIQNLQANTETLATIFEKEAEAAEVLATIDADVDALRQQVAEGGDGLIVMTSGGNVTALAPRTARAGRGSLLYETLGLTPSVEDIEAATHGEPISFEFLLEHDPTRLFVIDRDAAIGTDDAQPAAAVLDNELVQRTTFWQEENVTYLDPFDWYIIAGAGLQSAQRMLDEIAAAYDDAR